MTRANYEACFSQKIWTNRIKKELELW
jgi:hypothetical protein